MQFVHQICLFVATLMAGISPAWTATFASQSDDGIVSLSGMTMGTSYSIKLAGVSVERMEALRHPIQNRLDEIDSRMSTYQADSDVSRFNRAEAESWFAVSRETATVVDLALRESDFTSGAFDITVGPLVRLWGLGSTVHLTKAIPSKERIAETLTRVGYQKLSVRMSPPALKKQINDLEIDLSGIAKGYAVDQVAQILDREDVHDYLVEIGGEIRCSGHRSDGKPWTIGIEAPRSNTRQVVAHVSLSNGALASSGDYRNYFELDGVRYAHIIDPRTGWPIRNDISAATVHDSDCASADARATALLVMGAAAMDWCEQHDVAAILFERRPSGHQMHISSQWILPIAEFGSNPSTAEPSIWRLIIASLIVFAIAVLAMAVGLIFKGRCLRGTCGGMAGMTDSDGQSLCASCGRRSVRQTTENQPETP